MALSKVLYLAVMIAAAQASPVSETPSQVLRRDDPPAPSPFPLDGGPCEHEWQYLNFNPDDDTDKAHLQTLHDIICSGEMRAISSYGQISAQDLLEPYERYFPPTEEGDDDPEDDTEAIVAAALGLIAGTSSTDGMIGSLVASFIVDNNDFGANMPNAVSCSNPPNSLAYTSTDTADGREKTHFCDPAWDRGSAGDVDCGSLDPYPSTKMDSFSRVALHEMMHYSTVGGGTALGKAIVDVNNEDGSGAYDPPRCHGLLDAAQDDQPGKCDINADSYAWMSLDAWISRKCATDSSGSNWATFFTQSPPNYR